MKFFEITLVKYLDIGFLSLLAHTQQYSLLRERNALNNHPIEPTKSKGLLCIYRPLWIYTKFVCMGKIFPLRRTVHYGNLHKKK